MQNTLIEQGLSLTLFGMGTVFTFLILMVFATTMMSRLVAKYAPQGNEAETSVTIANTTGQNAVDPKTLSIIKKAIDAHRQR